MLVDEFAELTAVTFEQDFVFDGVLQEVVLLLGVKGRVRRRFAWSK